jgi:hypothetical protein
MRRTMIWLSGADPEILRDCTHLRNSERIRFAAQGALTLVPAMLGSVAMAYAISTVARQPLVYVGCGLLWGVVVLLVDRYLVATIHKSTVPGRGLRAVPLLARLGFAILIGIAVAHPLVLLWFDGSISQRIHENLERRVGDRLAQAGRAVAALPPARTSADSLATARQKQIDLRDCLVSLQIYEQSGQPFRSVCGATSATGRCGPRCVNIGVRIRQAGTEITDLDRQIVATGAADQRSADDRAAEAAAIDQRAAGDVAGIRAVFSDDYLARVAALEQLERESPQVIVVELFMIVFFVFVDLLPLTMKLTTPAGEYEQVRDTAILRASAVHGAQQEIAADGRLERVIAQAYVDNQRVLRELTMLTQVPVRLVRERDAGGVAFERGVRAIRQRAPGGSGIEPVEAEIAQLRRVHGRAWEVALARVMEYLTRQ